MNDKPTNAARRATTARRRRSPGGKPGRGPSPPGPVQAAAASELFDAGASPADLVANHLGGVVAWSRMRSLDVIRKRSGVDVDRSGILIFATLHRAGPMRMSDLAAGVGLDRSTISRQVAAVVRSGYVQKMGDEDDARASLLTLTPRGEAARRKLADAWYGMVVEMLGDWSVEDQADLGRLLGRLVGQMRFDGT